MSAATDSPELAGWVSGWRARVWIAEAGRALASAVAGFAVARWGAGAGLPVAAAVASAAFLVTGVLRRRRLRVAPERLALHLDRSVPALEESATLLLAAETDLPLLQRLQRRRAAAALAAVSDRRPLPAAPLLRAGGWMAAAVLAAALLAAVAPGLSGIGGERESVPPSPAVPEPATAGVGIESVEIEVVPPAYTGRPPRRSSGGAVVEAEEGAEVRWTVRTTGDARRVELVLDDVRRLPLDADGPDRFGLALEARSAHLYWLEVSGAAGGTPYRSDYARILLLPDRAPEVDLLRPVERVRLVEPDAGPLWVRARATDDHQVAALELVVTLASGAGEQVRFRERRLAMRPIALPQKEGIEAETRLDPVALGMTPGDELYLFAEAVDRRPPRPNRGRSETRIVRMAGERRVSAELGAGLPIFGMPQFFRSQRQIILDTEKLVAERERITPREFARRSESLGLDQRSLRMRYAGLLGEESEAGRPAGGEVEVDDELEEVAGWGDAAGQDDLSSAIEQLPVGFAHSHDSAEINTFFTDRVRRRLKAALGEMWTAEGRLRGGDPQGALPYEYRALEALKSAQEAERVYVQKTGFEPTPLEPERRLTGELEQVRGREVRFETPRRDAAPELRTALDLARRLAAGEGVRSDELAVVAAVVARHLAERAEAASDRDLQLLSRLREWSARDGPVTAEPEEAARLEAVLWRLLPPPVDAAVRPRESGEPIWEAYRRRLDVGS